MIKEILKKAIELYDAGNEEEAMKLFKKVLAIDPNNKVAKEYTGMSGDGEAESEDSGMDMEEDATKMEDVNIEDDAEGGDNDSLEGEIMTSLFDIFSRQNKGEEISGEEIDGVIDQLTEYKDTLGA